MRLNKSGLTIIISMLLISVLFASILNVLSTNGDTIKQRGFNDDLKMTNTTDHLIWFIQISDLHISIFNDPGRIQEFDEFCQHTIDVIRPNVVLASGDLTDAKTSDMIGSRQFEKEWKYYRNILDKTRVTDKTVWLDIRGNHDNFNVASPKSQYNYFTNYSIQGSINPKSYLYQLEKNSEKYTFIGVDACLEPGPKRPFNFVGLLDEYEINQINRLYRQTKESGSNYTIWFGHFPTSCILTTGSETVREIIGNDENGFVYLCGHLHTLGGLVPKMYTLQKNGFLELELGDWKDNRLYRILAIDHGLMSFIDIPHKQWPVALITNPKHSLYFNEARENMDVIRKSTHIRILAFSLVDIEVVRIRIDKNDWLNCKHVNGPLYVIEWDPNLYRNGLHNIEVYVKDSFGREKCDSQPFTLDETRLNFDLLPRIALMSDATFVFQIMFIVMLILLISPICLLRLIHKWTKEEKFTRPRRVKGFFKLWFRKFWILSTVDRIFWPLILYPIYLSFGPWSIGYLVEDHLGVIFAWGIFVNNAFLPGSLTYAYGFIQLFTFQLPLTIILAHAVDHRFEHKIVMPEKKKTIWKLMILHLPFILLFTIQINMAYFFWLAYGNLAFILGPLRTWSLILAAILWYHALYLPEQSTREAAYIWHLSPQINMPSSDVSLEQDKK